MAQIGFTVFKEKVLDGTKAQTIREPRKRPIRVGELLYLYWRLRRPDCELLKVARCIEVFTLKWGQMKDDLDLAQRDGFDDLDSSRRWFERYNPDDETEFLVIRWEAQGREVQEEGGVRFTSHSTLVARQREQNHPFAVALPFLKKRGKEASRHG